MRKLLSQRVLQKYRPFQGTVSGNKGVEMIGEYINMGLMLLILAATFWILRSPKKSEDQTERKERED